MNYTSQFNSSICQTVPFSKLNSIVTKISRDRFHSASNKVFFNLKSQSSNESSNQISSLIVSSSSSSWQSAAFKLSTSRVRGGEESQASSSNWSKSTFRGRNIMMLGVMDCAIWNKEYLAQNKTKNFIKRWYKCV